MKLQPALFASTLSALLSASAYTADDAIYQPWKMHPINNDYVIANSLNAADVDGDGYLDYAVIDEWLGIQTILFHPGKDGDVRAPWSRVNLGETGNPEYSCLGDIDGDGNIDFIVVTGDDLEKGYTTGVGIFWGPEKNRVRDADAWTYAGHIPSSLNQQYLYSECHDINGDGALDILVGGRRNSMTNQYAGIKWFEAPSKPEDRRDLSKWETHYIDRDAYSGHGFVVYDVDEDGADDLVIADADWDTPAFEERFYWYKNPGENSGSITEEWEAFDIWKSPAFYPKPQFGIGDLDNDGRDEFVTQTQNFINIHFRKDQIEDAWRTRKIRKTENIQWIGRPVRIADLNEDGKQDIIGMLIHNDGHLPKGKASVFWMESASSDDTENWTVHPIKQSDGYNSYHEWIGEKWDHCIIRDIDGDGDLDIIGNVEEHYQYVKGKELPESFFSVVWFENPLK